MKCSQINGIIVSPRGIIGTIANSNFESLGDGINSVAGSDIEMSRIAKPCSCRELFEMEQDITP